MTFGYNILWRPTVRDAVYIGAAPSPVAGTAGQGNRFTGRQYSFDLAWQVDRHVQIDAGYVRIDVGESLRMVGAHKVDFAYIAGAYKF